jgi:hypothetical protein
MVDKTLYTLYAVVSTSSLWIGRGSVQNWCYLYYYFNLLLNDTKGTTYSKIKFRDVADRGNVCSSTQTGWSATSTPVGNVRYRRATFFRTTVTFIGDCSFNKRHLLIACHTHTHTHVSGEWPWNCLQRAAQHLSGFVLCIIPYGLGVRYEVIRVETFLSAGFRGFFGGFRGLAALCFSSS